MSNTSGVITALPAPEGYVVDFENPQRRDVVETYVVVGIGMFLALLFLLQRLYVKVVIRKKFGLDDVLLLFGWVFTVAIQALMIKAALEGYVGVHGWEIPIEKFKDFTFWNSYINPIVYAIPPGACKMVILLFFLELDNNAKWFRWSVYITMFVVVGSSLSILFSSIFPCKPIPSAYDLVTDGECIDRVATFKATAAFGVITDVMIICIPIPMVLSLHISTRKKVGLLALFGIGSVTVITSVVRLYLLITILADADQTWGGIFINIWVSIEANLLVMCACLSTLRLFFHTVSPKLFSSGAGTTGKSGGVSGNGLRTIGGTGGGISAGHRSQYNRFDTSRDEPEYDMDTFHVQIKGGPRERDVERVQMKDSGGTWNDQDSSSDRAIVQTTETHIYISKA
ncbi:hypothetical protein CGMCC3_g1294 [Colletotrichum fructicola]|uniref:Rhodopsin domain-containing protein n=1 Tax=Colletotrichum fructicola (strain Nara gc5) TaxID=1213859 RepID=L2FXS1_COLFN|nr:uncharacterized protein CGMCC3_g1294 [Colletotrichum fructicola]KAE9583294.1 hypothetical protein CGMCC3_g1294 [Colletotrichum fructicola]KAF4412415.1 hypothetical protein CFRS1_v002398 [Colletotrichum fructicola]KAF4480265.1 hypothetical protein CGGC5_v010698 [Colletotrichum fructicola Nara gc5]KAF4887606.1 hypothetical protein CGCFRS4_v010369 [Colletotrichum fructicola]